MNHARRVPPYRLKHLTQATVKTWLRSEWAQFTCLQLNLAKLEFIGEWKLAAGRVEMIVEKRFVVWWRDAQPQRPSRLCGLIHHAGCRSKPGWNRRDAINAERAVVVQPGEARPIGEWNVAAGRVKMIVGNRFDVWRRDSSLNFINTRLQPGADLWPEPKRF